MKCIMLMYDSLNRHMLPPYGCDWTSAPNFQRLARKAATFDTSYVCSMPCMPARRDWHTGRPNFLHRSWGPLEPFDDSVPTILKQNGVSSHLMTDHYHYFETGGATYHPAYSTWQFFRGQESDLWMGSVAGLDPDAWVGAGAGQTLGQWRAQDRVNRTFMRREQDQPQAKTIEAGLDFIRRNHASDNWFLHIETFDPHEPFYSQRTYKDRYAEHYDNYDGPDFDWPKYQHVEESADVVDHVRHEYASLLSMCDAKLGDVLDAMDEYDLWQDTMLIVWTDHGFLLGEHDCWAKCWMPFYEEIAHTPFFVWDPRCPQAAGQRRQSLVQPAIDLGPTVLEFFGIERTPDMLGHSLQGVIADDTPVRDTAIFGMHGTHVNITDGRYVYMRSGQNAENQPLNEYTVMPTNMKAHFPLEQLQQGELAEPFSFTKDVAPIRMPARPGAGARSVHQGTLLFDVKQDPQQATPLSEPAVERRLLTALREHLDACDAPADQYQRLGL